METITTEQIARRITDSRAQVAADERIPADWIEEVYAGIRVDQQSVPAGWVVTWPFAHQSMRLEADADAEEIDRRVVRAVERTARNWEGE